MTTAVVRRRPAIVSSIPEWRKPIIAIPLSQAFPELGEVKEFKSKKCLFNHDRSKLFDVVSPKYQVVDHGAAVDHMSEALERYFGKKVESNIRSLDGGARIMGEFKLPLKQVQVKRGDFTDLTLSIRNSYDRTWQLESALGGLRLVCSNGMKIGEDFGGMKLRHVGVSEGNDQEYMLSQLDKIIKRAPMLRDIWTEWADTPMDYAEAVEMVDSLFPGKYIDNVLAEERFPRSKWDFYNDLTRFTTHDTKSVRRRVEFDDIISKLFYTDVPVQA